MCEICGLTSCRASTRRVSRYLGTLCRACTVSDRAGHRVGRNRQLWRSKTRPVVIGDMINRGCQSPLTGHVLAASIAQRPLPHPRSSTSCGDGSNGIMDTPLHSRLRNMQCQSSLGGVQRVTAILRRCADRQDRERDVPDKQIFVELDRTRAPTRSPLLRTLLCKLLRDITGDGRRVGEVWRHGHVGVSEAGGGLGVGRDGAREEERGLCGLRCVVGGRVLCALRGDVESRRPRVMDGSGPLEGSRRRARPGLAVFKHIARHGCALESCV